MSGDSRVEKVLQHILDGLTPTEPSMSRVEQILLAIAGEVMYNTGGNYGIFY